MEIKMHYSYGKTSRTEVEKNKKRRHIVLNCPEGHFLLGLLHTEPGETKIEELNRPYC